MIAVTEKGRILSDEEQLDPARTALVLIDIQNDLCHPDGLFGRLGYDLSMMPAIAERTPHMESFGHTRTWRASGTPEPAERWRSPIPSRASASPTS